MKYFLVKTDPKEYPVEKFAKEGETVWDGVRNAQAIKCIRSMRVGDKVFVYHSQGQNAIRGLAEVVSPPKTDEQNPSLWVVRLKYVKSFSPPLVSLEMVRQSGLFGSLPLVRQPRLSVMELPTEFVSWLKDKLI